MLAYRFHGLGVNDLVKAAAWLVVVNQFQAFFVEDLKKFLPVHLGQGFRVLGIEFKPQHAAGAVDHRRAGTVIRRPTLDFLMVASRVRCHMLRRPLPP